MSHPFQGGVGNRDESPFPRRGGGSVLSHPKGDKGGGGLHQSQPREGGGGRLW